MEELNQTGIFKNARAEKKEGVVHVVFLVDAFCIRYDVVGNERSVSSERSTMYIVLTSDSNGSCGLQLLQR